MNSVFYRAVTNHPEVIPKVFDALPEPTFLINKDGFYVEAWGGTDHTRHHSPNLVIGMHIREILPLDKACWFEDIVQQVLRTQQAYELEYELDPIQLPCFKGMDGPSGLQYFNAFVVPLAQNHVLWTVRNITEYKVAQCQLAEQQLALEKQTYTDHLTQVYNRFALEKLLPTALNTTIKNKKSAALFMIDIDCFKNLNDRYGHLQGDQALKNIASAIQNWGQNRKGECFRFGGDEFLVFMPELSKEEAQAYAQDLLSKIQSLQIPNIDSTVSDVLSITIGLMHRNIIHSNVTIEQFIAIADKALFYAKNMERGSIHMFNENGE
ncbi:sensor domain-containing diguanylate cyclase [Vibrio sp. 99-70-13A1]|uniref:sensor domain-containing diguanylate cyclase n=1 Tax=Vibrio sp. 99-70-13A1 TaxID=2607601 RepID=UPI0014933670|nr:sensor domain-containing diguanylate cyclase [Vibrio sp. 99-70-13A1]NOH96686.1 GGDEF domain-containing protein [Vibrio sp. 99-70-13A1]